ncbi:MULTISPECIES: ABC transporter ATP-binding protein [unclassified Haladaptatus]|uniref:ABC transporter ATP-binding protein n=1 Tax=unclassified Haladaptatus TaxID=2622732 RepID=UPI00209C1D67|nr:MULTISPECIES: ABC transporter ATP-binding protein [unclassified Haladaptatus]MCO8243656.1 ABC transporter ATP-binding protein [Haladaptatus sp. AB643]MCO8255065.1 ABC transporter ATP-binding protein [Haladaptatus sp. AB618]
MSLLSLEHIDVSYGDVQVIWDVSLSVDEGETVALLGANGAGKTTVLKTICGGLTPTSGSVIYKGEEIGHCSPDAVVPRGIAHVPEGREIFVESSVEENVVLGAHTNPDAAEERKEWVYDIFPRLEERREQTAGTLSGGEQQMLAIGRGLMSDPDLLLLDEASLGLAPVLVEDVFDAIEQITEQGVTVLLVEQDLHNAFRVADRGYVLKSGRIELSGDADELATDERVEASYLG